MSMNIHEMEEMITKGIPNSVVIIQDLAGDGNHYAAEIISEEFRGKNRIQQHKMVYAALEGKMGDTLHALSIKTVIPNSHNKGQ